MGPKEGNHLRTRYFGLATVLITACTAAPPASLPIVSRPPPATVAATVTMPEGSPGTAGLGDDLYPNLGNGGYDVLRYDLELELVEGGLIGKAAIEAVAHQDLSAFNLDLFEMQVTSVVVQGALAEYTHDAAELTITPVETILSGSRFTVEVGYEGSPKTRPSSSSLFAPGFLEAEDGTRFAFSEPDGASAWFPANDHPIDRAIYGISMTMPSDQTGVSAGRLVFDRTSGGKRTMTWETPFELSTYQVALVVGDLESTPIDPVNDRVTEVWSPPGTAGLAAFERLPDMIGFFEDRFGPFPLESYGAVVVDEDLPVALETRGLPIFTNEVLTFGEDVVAHELAHEWFGNHIILADWSEIWLNEGPATFATWLWREETSGRAAYDERVAGAYEEISGLNRVSELGNEEADATARAAYPPPGQPSSGDLFNASMYLRGGLAMVALRDLMGEEVFAAFLRGYVERFGGRAVNTAEFVELASAAAGEDLGGFFDEWLNQSRIPAMPERDLQPPV